jgi:hypothetical protein
MMDTKRFIASLPFDTYQESGCATIEGTPVHNVNSDEVHQKFPGREG